MGLVSSLNISNRDLYPTPCIKDGELKFLTKDVFDFEMVMCDPYLNFLSLSIDMLEPGSILVSLVTSIGVRRQHNNKLVVFW